jgi:type II restriction enzyme
MIFHNFHRDILRREGKEQVCKYLLDTLKPSVTLWSYFVNWEKVLRNTAKIELALNELTFLIGKDDFDSAFRFLTKENPKVCTAIPALVVRNDINSAKFNIGSHCGGY